MHISTRIKNKKKKKKWEKKKKEHIEQSIPYETLVEIFQASLRDIAIIATLNRVDKEQYNLGLCWKPKHFFYPIMYSNA